jgi:hypothetical protein
MKLRRAATKIMEVGIVLLCDNIPISPTVEIKKYGMR